MKGNVDRQKKIAVVGLQVNWCPDMSGLVRLKLYAVHQTKKKLGLELCFHLFTGVLSIHSEFPEEIP